MVAQYRVHNSRPVDPALSQVNPAHIGSVSSLPVSPEERAGRWEPHRSHHSSGKSTILKVATLHVIG
jgi:hypothetical protein